MIMDHNSRGSVVRLTEVTSDAIERSRIRWPVPLLGMDSAPWVRYRRHYQHATGDIFALGEQRKQNQSGHQKDLNGDGEKKRTAFASANARFLDGITFDKTATEKAGTFFGHTSDSHHTPPKNSREVREIYGASLLGCLQETGAALAGM